MRSLLVATVLALLAAAPAAADYRRVPVESVEYMTMAGGELYVVAGGKLTAHAPNGRRRSVALPKNSGQLSYVTASSRGLSLSMFPRRSYYRANGGRWERVKDRYAHVAVHGSLVSILHESRVEERRHSLEIINLRSGAQRRYPVRGERPVGVQIAGRYFAYMINFAVGGRETIIVRSVATGRELYRVKPGNAATWKLLPGGRTVVVTSSDLDRIYRVNLATPARPRLRPIRELGLATLDIAPTAGGIVVAHGDARARSDLALLGWNGRLRPLTPLLQGVEHVEFDGKRLAFSIGTCVFTGPLPAAGAVPPVAADGCLRSADGGAGR